MEVWQNHAVGEGAPMCQASHKTFGAPHHCPREVKRCAGGGVSSHDEVLGQADRLPYPFDVRLDPLEASVVYRRKMHRVPVRRCDLRHNVLKIALELLRQPATILGLRQGTRQAECGRSLVDGSEGLRSRVVFRNPALTQEPRISIIALT